MATYYVRTDGNNANVGTGSASNQAWQTITYALANMSLTNGTNYLYIAPGVYRESPTVTVTPSSTQTLEIVGDTTASIFIGVTAGNVRITNFANDNTNPSASTVFTCAKTYVALRNLCFVMYGTASFTNSQYITIDKCLFESTQYSNNTTVKMTANGTTPINATITKSIFIGSYCLNICGPTAGSTFNFSVAISDCLFIGQRTLFIDSSTSQFSNTGGNGLTVYNSTFICDQGFGLFTTNATNQSVVRNCNFIGNGVSNSFGIVSQGTDRQTEDYNRFSVTTARSNCSTGASSITGLTGIDWSTSLLNSQIPVAIFAPFASSPLTGSGTSTGAPSTDIYSNNWTTGTDVGAFARTSLASTSFYFPSERNASTITIAPGSTSQSIELYLGATGLTASTTGLSARYNRTRTASVNIPLVARTIAQAWTAGGFAEVDTTNMPGVYRLDLPDAALAAGADDVTVVVRGASGTNGAVMTIKLSSGGLTSAQTASAVWDAVASSYNTAGSMGEAGQRLTGYSLASSQTFSTTGSVGSVTGAVTVGTNNDKTGYTLSSAGNTSAANAVWNKDPSGYVAETSFGGVVNATRNVAGNIEIITTDTPSNVWEELRTNHTTAGTFGQYVNADLVTPVSQGSLVYMGPYQVIADGVTTPQPLDIQKGAVTGIGIQLVDNNLSGISITGATVTTKIYNAGGSLVATYACTATYAADGRASFTINTTVTNTPGTYTATITRTTGASDTQVFGPLRIYVRDI